eukprot:1240160-Amphidinium_carterae.1
MDHSRNIYMSNIYEVFVLELPQHPKLSERPAHFAQPPHFCQSQCETNREATPLANARCSDTPQHQQLPAVHLSHTCPTLMVWMPRPCCLWSRSKTPTFADT